ncbi:hypothetical protein LG634_07015 [Streptomyces bambusae]|uniref:hypothetical protein n=1 Tax=Streptomyces bambusae TaxID=1550616 RepID=UPI001CFF3481|nr:hypothetical protein [Streptomyces bambusae]MCB5164584.1 hypothetical protein [Streptomyces bambusae]
MFQHPHGPDGPADPTAACGGPLAPAPAREGRRSQGDAAPAALCLGHDPGRNRYFWRCRLCMLLHEGFETEQEARRMLRVHCELRRVEHCVGAAVRRKRAAGRPAELSRAELTQALRRDPGARWCEPCGDTAEAATGAAAPSPPSGGAAGG